jgi:acetyl esterase/lipase
MIRRSGFAWPVLLLAVASLGADGTRSRRDVAYSDASPALRLNIDAPREGDGHPIIVWVHGGGWRRGDKDYVGDKPKAFNEKGYAWVSVDYRFIPEATPREQAGDVARAVRWTRDHAEEFGGDPKRIFLMGHSAGAHLAALTATDERPLEAVGMKPSDLAGVVLLDGAGYDVPRQIREARLPALRKIYLDAFGVDPKAQAEASPIEHVAKGRGIPPFLILHVGRVDSRAQSRALAARLREAGVAAKVEEFPSKTHMTINRELGRPDDGPTRAVLDFLAARPAS